MNKLYKFIIGFIISFAGLWYAFQGVDLQQIKIHLVRTDITYLILSMVVMVSSVMVRAMRWKLILIPLHTFKLKPLYKSTMIGYFGNGVLPFRLGELLRAYAISRSNSISSSAAFGTILLERLLDLIGLAVLMAIVAFLSPLMEWSGNILFGLIIFTVCGFIFVFWLGKSHSKFHEIVVHWKLFEKKSGQTVLRIINNILKGLTSIRKTKHTGGLIFYTITLWFMYFVCTYLIVLATQIDISWIGACIILIATTLAISIPSAPGYVGTYHAAAVYVLVNILHAGVAESQAFSVLIHAIGYIPLVIIGFVYFLQSSIHFKEIKSVKVPS
ncbi:MAG: flippase-like domain-containing protein [Candidatus Marinimicrobia bacterium]|nr:flippase-like domain-containing protein [Candidatus Neomarinimicrobiota bacterium]